MKIIGFLPNRRFIGHILKTFQYNTGFSSFGRLELYLVMTPYLFKVCRSSIFIYFYLFIYLFVSITNIEPM